MSTALRFEPMLRRRPLADVLAALDADAPACLAPVPVPDGSRRRLLAAVALAQARLTGESTVCLYEQHAGRWREREVTLDPAAVAGRWVESLARAPARPLCSRTAAELALALDARPRRPAQALAQISVVRGQLLVDVDPLRVDRLAATALRDAIVAAWQALHDAGDQPLGMLSILSPQQRANLLCRWQNLRHTAAEPLDLLAHLRAVAARCGDAPAIVEGERTLSHAALWQQSTAVAQALLRRGVAGGDVVAVQGPRSIEWIVATLAVWRAGATCLPLDAALAPPRRAALLDVCAAVRLLSTAATAPPGAMAFDELLADTGEPHPWPEATEQLLLLDADADRVPTAMPMARVGRRVAIDATGLWRIAHGVEFDDPKPRRMLQIAPVASVRAVFECWSALLAGGACVLHDEPQASVDGLARTLTRHAVDCALLPDLLFERIASRRPVLLAALEELLVGPLPPQPASIKRVRLAAPAVAIRRVYGYAECTPFALCETVDDAGRSLGRPLPGSSVHVLASDGGLLPVGAIGEVCVGGCAVTRGYRGPDGRFERGASAFVVDPLGTDGARLFRTGDRGRRLPDGRIEHVAVARVERSVRDATDADRRIAPRRTSLPCAARSSVAVRVDASRDTITVVPGRLAAASRRAGTRALADLCARYRERTAGSLARAGRDFIDAPLRLDYPLVLAEADGAQVVDIDGNRYVDGCNGNGSRLFGGQPAFLRTAWQQQLGCGTPTGGEHPLQAEVAAMLARLTRGSGAALCGSPADALALALRIARRHSGRDRVVHVQARGNAMTRRQSDHPMGERLDLLDADAPGRLDDSGAPLAALVIAPFDGIDGNGHARRAVAAWLARAQALGAVTILDERAIGLRCAPGGARQYLAVDADLSVFGDMLADGLPFGAVVASGAIGGVDTTHEIRHDCHPLAIAGAAAVLGELQRIGPGLQHELNARTAEFVRDGNRLCRRLRLPVELHALSSCWQLRLLDREPRLRYLFPLLRLHGLHVREDRPASLGWAHRMPEIGRMLDALAAALGDLGRILPPRAAGAPIVLRPLPAQRTPSPTGAARVPR